MNQRKPIAFPVLSLLDGIGLKPEFWIEQQASKVLIEAGHADLGGQMFRESKLSHLLHQIAANATPSGPRGHDDISNRTTAARLPAVEIGEGDNLTIKLYNRRV